MFTNNKETDFNPLMKEATKEIKSVMCGNCRKNFRVAYIKMVGYNRDNNYIYCPGCNKQIKTEMSGIVLKD